MKVSKDSEATSKPEKVEKVKEEKHPEFVTIPYDKFVEYTDQIDEGNTLNKKGGAAVTEATEGLKAAAKDYRKVKYFGVVEGGFAFDGFGVGLGGGLIFKDALILKVGIEKKNICDMTDWLDWKNAYRGTASVGIVF